MAISAVLKFPALVTRRSIAPASSILGSSRNVSAMQRSADDVVDQLNIRHARLLASGSNAGIGLKAGIGIDLQDERPARLVDAEIHPGIAGEAEKTPAGLGQPLQRLAERLFALAPMEDSRRVAVFGRGLVPFGRIADDARPVGVPLLEHHFADGKHERCAFTLDQRHIELPSFDIGFGEPASAVARGARLRASGDRFAPRYDRAVVEPERGVLADGFYDPAVLADAPPVRRLGPSRR